MYLFRFDTTVSELTGPDSYTFADDFIFVTGTSPRDHQQSQYVASLVNGGSKDNKMPLSLNKKVRCIAAMIILQYILNGQPLPVMSQFNDLGVLRSEGTTCRDHINIVAPQCSKLCGAILHSFRTRQPTPTLL